MQQKPTRALLAAFLAVLCLSSSPAPAQDFCATDIHNCAFVSEPLVDGNGTIGLCGLACDLGNQHDTDPNDSRPGLVINIQDETDDQPVMDPWTAGVPLPGAQKGNDIANRAHLGADPPAPASLPSGVTLPSADPNVIQQSIEDGAQESLPAAENAAHADFDSAGHAPPPETVVHPGREQDSSIPALRPGLLTPDLGGQNLDEFALRHGDDPVNPATGEFSLERVDLELPALGDVGFRMVRLYRSRTSARGVLGYGWTHSYEQRLVITTPSCNTAVTADWTTGRGSVIRFTDDGAGRWRSLSGTNYRMSTMAGGEFEITSPEGVRHRFDKLGILLSETDRNGNSMTFKHVNGRLEGVRDPYGREVAFRYDNASYLDRVEVLNIIAASLDYDVDALGDLVRAGNSDGVSESYDYDTDAARKALKLRVPEPDLVMRCSAMCGGECGGVCATAADEARADCVAKCNDVTTCDQRCQASCNSNCDQRALNDVNVGRCETVCRDGIVSEPRPDLCGIHEPPHNRGDYDECMKNGTRRDWPTQPEERGTTPKPGCLDNLTWDAQQRRYNECLATPPADVFRLSGYSEQSIGSNDRCENEACGEELAGPSGQCPSACGTTSCDRVCRDKLICAEYREAEFSFYIGIGGGWTYSDDEGLKGSNYHLTTGLNGETPHFDYSGGLWTGASCMGRSCLDAGRAWFEGDGSFHASDPDGRYEWRCNYTDCMDRCDDSRCVASCNAAVDNQCRANASAACASNCRADCAHFADRTCQESCAVCQSECVSELPSACEATCDSVDWTFECSNTCTQACIAENRAAGPVYGNLVDLDHNLITIIDGTGKVTLRNDYEADPSKPSFDKVKNQEIGTDKLAYRYYDLERNESIALLDRLFVDNKPKSVDLCTSTCETNPVNPRPPGRERWIRVLGDDFMIFPVDERLDASPGVAGWPAQPVEGEGLGAHRWFEITAGTAQPKVGRIAPVTRLFGPVKIPTEAGELLIRPGVRDGEVTIKGAPAALDAAFQKDGKGALTLLRSESGWSAIPGRAVAAAQISAEHCMDHFEVVDEGGLARPHLSPVGACRGELSIRELGRRGGHALGALLPAAKPWQSLLTDPRARKSYQLDKGGQVTLDDRNWLADPFAKTGAELSAAGLCEPPVLAIPDSGCEAGVANVDRLIDGTIPFPMPDCTRPFYARGGGATYRPNPDGKTPVLGCGVGPGAIEPGADMQCDEPDVHTTRTTDFQSLGSSVQPIARATVIVDPTGVPWVYYSSRDGWILRVVNGGTLSRVDWNLDPTDGHVIGARSAWGDITCSEQLDGRYPLITRRFPALGDPGNAQGYVESVVHRGRYGLPWEVLDPVTGDVRTKFVRDARGNATSVEQYKDDGSVLITGLKVDAKGRLTTVTHPDLRVDQIVYDSAGNLDSVTLAKGTSEAQTTRYDADSLGHTTRIEGTHRPTEQLSYSGMGTLLSHRARLTASSDEVITTFKIDAAGHVERETGKLLERRAVHDERGAVTVELMSAVGRTDLPAQRTCQRFRSGRLVDVIDPEGRWMTLSRDAHGDVIHKKMGIGKSALGTLAPCSENLKDPLGPGLETVETLERNPGRGGAVVARREAPGTSHEVVTRFVRDGFGRVVEAVAGDGIRERTGYDAYGRVAWRARLAAAAPNLVAGTAYEPSLTDRNLLAVSYFEYDTLGRQTGVREGWFDDSTGQRQLIGSGWRISRSRADDKTRTVNIDQADGRTVVVTLDVLGREKQRTLADGVTKVTSDYAVDSTGRLSVTQTTAPVRSDGGSNYSRRVYTRFGALAETYDASGRTYFGEYDALGRKSRLTTPLATRSFTYSPFGPLEEVNRVDGTALVLEKREHFRRDGRADWLEDGEGRRLEFRYDRLSRPVETRFPDDTVIGNTYLYGSTRPDVITDRDEGWRKYEYDAAGRLQHVTGYRGGSEAHIELVWGALGVESGASWRVTSGATRDRVGITRKYDSLGRLVSERDDAFAGYPLRYGYDPLGRPISLRRATVPIELSRDALGRVDSISRSGVVLADPVYAGWGPPSEIKYDNGVSESLSFDVDGRLIGKQLKDGSETRELLGFAWGQDRALARVDRNGASDVYRGDALGRLQTTGKRTGLAAATGLVSASAIDAWLQTATQREEFTFDNGDALVGVTRNGATTNPVVRDDLALTDFGGTMGADADGRVTSGPDGTVYTWDGLGHLETARLDDGRTWTFRYDAFGLLASWNDGTRDVRIQRAQGTPIQVGGTSYVPGLGGGPLATIVSNAVTYNHYLPGDRLAVATDANGDVTERYEWDVWGTPKILAPDGRVRGTTRVNNQLLLGGQPWIAPLEMHAQGQRWYRPAWGRFLSPDPAGLIDGTNRFGYAGGNPAAYVDPTGLSRSPIDAARLDDGDLGSFNGLTRTAGTTADAGEYRTQARIRAEEESGLLGSIPIGTAIPALIRIPIPKSGGLHLSLRPAGWTPATGSTSTIFLQSVDGKTHLRLDYGHNIRTGRIDYHWNSKGTYAKFGVQNHTSITPQSKGAWMYNGAKYYRAAGKLLVVVGVGVEVYNIVQAENKPKQVTKSLGVLGGGWVGAKAGGYVGGGFGTAIEPGGGTAVGGLVGGILGGIGGAWAGGEITETVYETIFEDVPELDYESVFPEASTCSEDVMCSED